MKSPFFRQQYSFALLSTPLPKCGDSCETFGRMWKEVLKLWRKLENNPKKRERCEALKLEILELYERAKIKEKEREGQTDHKTQGFGYSVALPTQLDEDVFGRLNWGRKTGSLSREFRKYHSLSKIRKRGK